MRAVLALAIVAAASAQARADARVEYVGDACREEAVVARVAALAGRAAEAGARRVAIRVDGAAGALRASVEVSGRERRVEAKTCEDLANQVALIVAMALAAPADADADASDAPASDDAPASAPPASAAPASTDDDELPAAPRIRSLDPELAAHATAAPPASVRLATLAGASASDHLRPTYFFGARARRGALSAGLEFSLDATDTVAVRGGSAAISRAGGTLAPCAHAGDLAACATLTVGRLAGRAEGFPLATAAAMPYGVVGARLVWERALTASLAVQVRADGGVSLTSNRFVADSMTVWTADRFEARLGIGVVARIP